MNVPYWLLRCLPMWEYICPKCKKEVKRNSHECPHCHEKYPMTLKIPPTILKDSKKLEAYVHKHIFPRVSALERAYLTKYFTVLFSDGWETAQDFTTNWTGTVTVGAGSTITVVTTDPHHGTYHADAYTSVAASAAYAHKTIAEQTTVFHRNYIKVKTNLPSSSNYYHVMGLFAGGVSGTVIAYAAVYNDAGTVKWVLRYRSGASLLTAVTSETVNLDTWYCVELKVVIHGSAGEAKLYIDGSEVASQTSLDTDNYGNINCIIVGERYSSGATTHDIYVDCVVVADAYIGPEAAGGLSIPVAMHHYNRINKIIRG